MSEGIYQLHEGPQERAKVLERAIDAARQRAVEAGAAAKSCQVCIY